MSSFVERAAREAEVWDHQSLQRERYELFHLPAAVLSRFFFKRPVNLLTFTFDRLDHALAFVFPKAGIFYRTVAIYGHRPMPL